MKRLNIIKDENNISFIITDFTKTKPITIMIDKEEFLQFVNDKTVSSCSLYFDMIKDR
jgi:hypothetical protein